MLLHLLRQPIYRTVHQFSEERKESQCVSVRFSCYLFFMPKWKAFDKKFLLIQVKFLFQLRLLFNIILYFLDQIRRKIIFRCDES